MEKSVIIFCQ